MRCFYHFDFEICFASQRPALLQDLNVQKHSKAEVLWVFWLGNVLRATTPWPFWTSQLPKVCLNTWCFYHFDFDMCFAPQHATTACAFSTSELPKALRAWGVFTCWLPNLLRATTPRIFQSFIYPDGSAPAALASFLLDLRSHKTLEKHSVSRLFCLFAHLDLVSSDSFSSLLWLFPPLLFHLSMLSVGSLTSKRPSIIVGDIFKYCFSIFLELIFEILWSTKIYY